jgi:Uma2 family endonuclease
MNMFDASTHQPVSFGIRKEPKRTYSLEEYLRKEAKSKYKHEFINGQIVRMPYAKGPHNIISANISAQMVIQFDQSNQHFIVFSSDQKIYFPSLNVGVYADALAVCEQPLYWDDEELLLINPIIVVEVLSKSTSRYDRTGKFEKYKTLESFKEYVLVRQDQHYVETWHQLEKGLWKETIVTDLTASVSLASVGIEIAMERIYRNVEL